MLKPASKYQIIQQCHNFKNILFNNFQQNPFLYRAKVLLTLFSIEPKIANCKDAKLTIQTFIYSLMYSGARKAFYKIMHHNEIYFGLLYRNLSFQGMSIMCKMKYLNKLRHFAKCLAKSF